MATKNLGTLQAGQTVTITGKYKATESDMGKTNIINTVTAKSGNLTASASSAAATMEAVRYAFDATKTQSNTPANGTAFAEGETITWDIKATNTGNQTLSGLKITEKLTGAVLPNGDTLSNIAPKGNATKQAKYTVLEKDLERSDMRNVVDISNANASKSNVYSPFFITDKRWEPTIEFKGIESTTLKKGSVTTNGWSQSYSAHRWESVVKSDEEQLAIVSINNPTNKNIYISGYPFYGTHDVSSGLEVLPAISYRKSTMDTMRVLANAKNREEVKKYISLKNVTGSGDILTLNDYIPSGLSDNPYSSSYYFGLLLKPGLSKWEFSIPAESSKIFDDSSEYPTYTTYLGIGLMFSFAIFLTFANGQSLTVENPNLHIFSPNNESRDFTANTSLYTRINLSLFKSEDGEEYYNFS